MLADTHCHLNMMVKKEFDVPLSQKNIEDAAIIVAESYKAGISYIINVGTSIIESKNCLLLAKKLPSNYASVGIHPNDCDENWKDDITSIKEMLLAKKRNKIVGIGESGLDFHYPGYKKDVQKDVFKAQIEIALENSLPIIIHMRDATEETLRVVQEYVPDLKGVFHCFSEDTDIATQVTDWGFHVGIGGAVTYPKNDYLRNVAFEISISSLLFETDAPFMPPQTMRGKQNSPKHIRTIAEYIGKLRNMTLETIAKQTTNNAKKLFNIE